MELDKLSVVLNKIPKTEPQPETFFDVAGIQHSENRISNTYQYFLSLENEVSPNFLNALIKLINEYKPFDFSPTDFSCETEVRTKNGGRIDLLITINDDPKKYIIIENKINHHLNNDLSDYWESLEGADENKVGIVLTLNKQNIDDSRYICITHIDWINQIKRNGLPANLSTNQYVYLNDFFNNINNLTMEQTFTERTAFYFDNVNAINTALEIRRQAIDFIVSKIRVAAEELELKFDGQAETYRRIWDGEEEKVYFTISFEQFLKDKSPILIIIELYKKEAIEKADDILKGLEEKKLLKSTHQRKTRVNANNWMHLIVVECPIKEAEELGKSIKGEIRELLPIMKETKQVIN